MTRITVVAALDESRAATADQITRAMLHRRSTETSAEFTGRPSTRVWADDDTVVKLRPELRLVLDDAPRWVDARLEKERALDLYPPRRTWFLRGDGIVEIGVACHRLTPLHLRAFTDLDEVWDAYCVGFSELYLRAADAGWRLDEGLSNFAFDEDGALRYLDDDLYAWDQGVGLEAFLTVLPRRAPWLTAAHGTTLGAALRDQLSERTVAIDAHAVGSALRDRASEFLTALADALTAPRFRQRAVERESSDEPIVVIADVHANFDALRAVLAEPEVADASRVLLLGDIVGYGPDPDEVVALLAADDRVEALKGNHDLTVEQPELAATYTPEAQWSAQWTRDRLSDPARDWLAALPLELTGDDWLAVHGAPADPSRLNGYVYRMTADDNLARLELDGVDVCFHGNTHVQGVWRRPRRGLPAAFENGPVIEFVQKASALVCPGSVGQPRDGVPGAAYAIYRPRARAVELRRVAYDAEPVAERMRASGFPERLVKRLLMPA